MNIDISFSNSGICHRGWFLRLIGEVMSSAVKAVVRVGVGCLVTSPLHPNCLLWGVRRGSHGAGQLALPGGHLEVGESWEECAAREVQEETNLLVAAPKMVMVTNDVCMGGDPSKHYITIFMTAHIADNSPELVNMEPHKCERWEWVPWPAVLEVMRDTPERLFDPMRNFINTIESSRQTGKVFDAFPFTS